VEAIEVERLTVQAFVVPGRQQRWLADLERPMLKRRKTVRLHDTRDFDLRWAEPVPREAHQAESVAATLKDFGSPDSVWLMQAHDLAEPRDLVDAVRDAIRTTEGLVVCVPGRLAFLETEDSGAYIFRRERS
jgi:hypothetical protein